jgi:hypothetical protein
VIIRRGEKLEKVDITMKDSPAYCADALLLAGGAPSPLEYEIVEDGPVMGRSFYISGRLAKADVGGRMQICGLYTGQYSIIAMSPHNYPTKPEFFGKTSFAVGDRDLPDVVVVDAQPGVPLRVRVEWDGEAPRAAVVNVETIGLRIRSLGLTSPIIADIKCAVPGECSQPGNLPMTDYEVITPRLSSGVYIKDIVYGGESVLGRALRLGSAVGNPELRIIMKKDGGGIAVVVRDKESRPVSQARVYLIPKLSISEEQLAEAAISGQTGQDGVYTSPTLPPGTYLALAVIAPLDLRSPEGARALVGALPGAKDVEVGPGSVIHVTIEPSTVSRGT